MTVVIGDPVVSLQICCFPHLSSILHPPCVPSVVPYLFVHEDVHVLHKINITIFTSLCK